MVFWGVDLARSKVAVARLPLPESGVLFLQAASVPREYREAEVARACQLAGTVREALRAVGTDDVLAIESPWSSRMGSDLETGMVFGQCLRVIFGELSGRVFFVAPATLKCFTTGNGKDPKSRMALCAYKQWGFEARLRGDAQEDEVDAYCLAQMARCLVEPEDFHGYQREALERAFQSSGKRHNPECLVRPQCPSDAPTATRTRRERKGGGRASWRASSD